MNQRPIATWRWVQTKKYGHLIPYINYKWSRQTEFVTGQYWKIPGISWNAFRTRSQYWWNNHGHAKSMFKHGSERAPKLSLKIIVLVKEFCCLWIPRRDQDTNDIRFGDCIPATRPCAGNHHPQVIFTSRNAFGKSLFWGATRTNQVPFATPFGTPGWDLVTFLGLRWVSWPHPTSAKAQAVERVVWTTQVGVANAHLNSAPNVQLKEKIWSIWTKMLVSSFSPLHFPRHLFTYVFIYKYIYITT